LDDLHPGGFPPKLYTQLASNFLRPTPVTLAVIVRLLPSLRPLNFQSDSSSRATYTDLKANGRGATPVFKSEGRFESKTNTMSQHCSIFLVGVEERVAKAGRTAAA
jgi:hypothetical protein